MKWIKFAVSCAIVIAAATFTAVRFGGLEARRLRVEVDRLEQERQRLLDYAKRLSASRRVAQVDVVRQRVGPDGQKVSTLVWQEIGPDGTLGKPIAVETVGAQVYFEALVLKFDSRLVGEGDPERGGSLAMFRRIFGEAQPPESVPDLDRQARPPTSDPAFKTPLHDELWGRFWEMVDDPRIAARYGVRVAQCEAPSVPLLAGQTWELTLDAAGGLNVRRLLTRQAGGVRPDLRDEFSALP